MNEKDVLKTAIKTMIQEQIKSYDSKQFKNVKKQKPEKVKKERMAVEAPVDDKRKKFLEEITEFVSDYNAKNWCQLPHDEFLKELTEVGKILGAKKATIKKNLETYQRRPKIYAFEVAQLFKEQDEEPKEETKKEIKKKDPEKAKEVKEKKVEYPDGHIKVKDDAKASANKSKSESAPKKPKGVKEMSSKAKKAKGIKSVMPTKAKTAKGLRLMEIMRPSTVASIKGDEMIEGSDDSTTNGIRQAAFALQAEFDSQIGGDWFDNPKYQEEFDERLLQVVNDKYPDLNRAEIEGIFQDIVPGQLEETSGVGLEQIKDIAVDVYSEHPELEGRINPDELVDAIKSFYSQQYDGSDNIGQIKGDMLVFLNQWNVQESDDQLEEGKPSGDEVDNAKKDFIDSYTENLQWMTELKRQGRVDDDVWGEFRQRINALTTLATNYGNVAAKSIWMSEGDEENTNEAKLPGESESDFLKRISTSIGDKKQNSPQGALSDDEKTKFSTLGNNIVNQQRQTYGTKK